MKTLIRNARVLTMAEADYESADILIEDGRIAAVGANLVSAGAGREIDASGLTAMPGIIDAHCHVGMWEDGMGFEGSDGNEAVDPVTPQLRAIDGINPRDRCFEEALQAGVTTICTGPGSANVIGGTFVTMKTRGRTIEEMIVQEPAALKVAFGENPKRVYSGQKKSPSTRMATAAMLRQALVDAQSYMKKMDAADDDKKPDLNLGKEAQLKALRGEIPLKCHAHRIDDILTAARIAKEFGVRFTLDHCTEGYMIPDLLREIGAPVIIGPLLSDRSKIELKNLSFKAPATLHQNGIKFAMMTDHPVIPIQYLIVTMAIAVREGLPEREALKAVTLHPAEFLGQAHRLGSIEPGKDADMLLTEGSPLDVRSRPKLVFVGGEIAYQA